MHQIRIEPKRLDLAQGEQGSLRCNIEGTSEAKWSKAGGEINAGSTSIRGTELYFFNVQVQDRGVYICGVENESGASRDSAILEVERREKPQIEIYPSNNQTVIEGSSALFQCRILSGIPNPEVVWKSLYPLANNVEILANGGVIRITDIKKSNQAYYECSAENVAGSATARAYLTVQIPPKISLNPASGSIQIKTGESLQLVCSASGDPQPEIKWEKISGYISNRPSFGSNTYNIQRASLQDEGSYICKAKSLAGEMEEVVQIIVSSGESKIVSCLYEF